ncbi:hypothetical protein [Streptomyces sp. YKOK-I1]
MQHPAPTGRAANSFQDTHEGHDEGRELAGALPLDAATLLAIDPVTGSHVQVAGIGYTAETSESMAAEFVATS